LKYNEHDDEDDDIELLQMKTEAATKKDGILASASITTVYHKKRRKYLSLQLVLNKLKELKMYKAYSSKCRAKEHSIAIWIKKRFLKIFFHTWKSMKRCWRTKKVASWIGFLNKKEGLRMNGRGAYRSFLGSLLILENSRNFKQFFLKWFKTLIAREWRSSAFSQGYIQGWVLGITLSLPLHQVYTPGICVGVGVGVYRKT